MIKFTNFFQIFPSLVMSNISNVLFYLFRLAYTFSVHNSAEYPVSSYQNIIATCVFINIYKYRSRLLFSAEVEWSKNMFIKTFIRTIVWNDRIYKMITSFFLIRVLKSWEIITHNKRLHTQRDSIDLIWNNNISPGVIINLHLCWLAFSFLSIVRKCVFTSFIKAFLRQGKNQQ